MLRWQVCVTYESKQMFNISWFTSRTTVNVAITKLRETVSFADLDTLFKSNTFSVVHVNMSSAWSCLITNINRGEKFITDAEGLREWEEGIECLKLIQPYDIHLIFFSKITGSEDLILTYIYKEGLFFSALLIIFPRIPETSWSCAKKKFIKCSFTRLKKNI